jgi:hypothetical protein
LAAIASLGASIIVGSRIVKVDPRLCALDRDVAAHHLTEALADREPKARATVFCRSS